MAILYYDPKNRVVLIIGEIPGANPRVDMPLLWSPITPIAGNKILGRHCIRPDGLT
jgi:hypothetical protein